jgi:membrane dipeptidase
MNKITRRAVCAALGAAALGAAACKSGIQPSGHAGENELAERARKFLQRHAAIDVHAHPGRTFLQDGSGIAEAAGALLGPAPTESESVAAMQAVGFSAVCFSAVADLQVLQVREDGLHAGREFQPGEAWRSLKNQLESLRRLETENLVKIVRSPEDIGLRPKGDRVGAILGIEGGDFLEGQLERVQEVHELGVRTITLVHYRRNEIGDIMTEPDQSRGLTSFGVEVVKEMNRVGLLIDLAHAAESTALRALEHTSRPVMISHTHVRTEKFDYPRFISLDLAKAVAAGGGVIGAWPAGIGISTLDGFADRIIELVELLGVEHVCLGTDMDANYRPVFHDYRQLPELVALLFAKGMTERDLAKIVGENFLRVFSSAVRAA